MDWKTLFLSADGRIGRRDFWIGVALLFVAHLALNFIPVLGHLAMLALIYCTVCVYAKRLHDMGQSGWLIALPYVVFAVAVTVGLVTGGVAMIGALAHGGDAAVWTGLLAAGGLIFGLMGLAGLLWLAFLLWVGLSPTQAGPNRYGGHPTPLTTTV